MLLDRIQRVYKKETLSIYQVDQLAGIRKLLQRFSLHKASLRRNPLISNKALHVTRIMLKPITEDSNTCLSCILNLSTSSHPTFFTRFLCLPNYFSPKLCRKVTLVPYHSLGSSLFFGLTRKFVSWFSGVTPRQMIILRHKIANSDR